MLSFQCILVMGILVYETILHYMLNLKIILKRFAISWEAAVPNSSKALWVADKDVFLLSASANGTKHEITISKISICKKLCSDSFCIKVKI